MKKIIWSLTYSSLLLITVFVSGCCSNETAKKNNYFKTKEDSLNFVAEVIKKYPKAQKPIVAEFGNKSEKALAAPKFDGLNFADALTFAKNYDGLPLIDNVEGFMIDEGLLSLIRSHSEYK